MIRWRVKTYAEFSDEVLVVNLAAAALVEIFDDLVSLNLAKVVAKVNHGPTEVFGVHTLGALLVDGCETIFDGLD